MATKALIAAASLIALAGCGSAKDQGSVDTTLANGTAALETNLDTMPVDNTMVVDMNASGDVDPLPTGDPPAYSPDPDNMDRTSDPAQVQGDRVTSDSDTPTAPTLNAQQQ